MDDGEKNAAANVGVDEGDLERPTEALDQEPTVPRADWGTVPKTRKGRRTKKELLESARKVFRAQGYANARISDIAETAGLSNGAFYRYFQDKNDVLMALLHQLSMEMYEFSRVPWEPGDPRRSVFLTTVRYFELYRDNADLIRVEIERAQVDLEVRTIWRDARQRFYERIARSLKRGQRQGIVRPDVDPDLSAALLGGMTEHYAYLAFVLAEEPERPVEEISEDLANLWANGIVNPEAPAHS